MTQPELTDVYEAPCLLRLSCPPSPTGSWFGGLPSLPEDAPGFVRKLADMMEAGQFRGVFDRSYPLEDIVEAFRYVEMGQKTGIVAIEVQ